MRIFYEAWSPILNRQPLAADLDNLLNLNMLLNRQLMSADLSERDCSKEALQINRDLDNIKAQIIKHYQHLSDREAFVTAEMVRRSALATLCLQRTPIRDSAASMRPC